MPSVSDKERRFMGADYARAKRGEKTETGMSKSQLRDFATRSHSRGNPMRYLGSDPCYINEHK